MSVFKYDTNLTYTHYMDHVEKNTDESVVNIFADTCVWLDLAKQSDGGKVISILKELSNRGKIQLIVPHIVLDEFERNKGRIQADMRRSVSAKFREVRNAIDEHGSGEGRQEAISQLDNITHQMPLINQMATQNFDAIVQMLQAGKTIVPSNGLHQRVVERALDKRAPFHREKNSVADAMLIEMYGVLTKDAKGDLEKYCFITHNIKDFSAVDGDTRHSHPDFAEFFGNQNSRYFTSLEVALKSYVPDDVIEFDLEFEPYEELRSLDEINPFLDKLLDQIWYNRHKNREYQIETGKIKLVEKWQRNTSHNTIQRSIWEGAQAAALAVEEKYGKEELGPWDDFEWGMLSGKMSAIRWMLGEDWESTLDN